jgi:hypothetical protein
MAAAAQQSTACLGAALIPTTSAAPIAPPAKTAVMPAAFRKWSASSLMRVGIADEMLIWISAVNRAPYFILSPTELQKSQRAD